MLDVLTRALRHPVDYAGVVRSRTLYLRDHQELGDNIHTFVFGMNKPFTWQAGQHALFTLPGQDVRGKSWRAFSIASSPREGVVRIATVIPDSPSDFKKKLLCLRHDDPVRIFGPFGEFHARGTQHIIGVAGGIGITPFRALAYDSMRQHQEGTRLTLIYSARSTFAFKDELDSWQNDRFRITYVHTPEEVGRALATYAELHKNRAHYYISGPPGMIIAVQDSYTKLGIRKIVHDPFTGY